MGHPNTKAYFVIPPNSQKLNKKRTKFKRNNAENKNIHKIQIEDCIKQDYKWINNQYIFQ